MLIKHVTWWMFFILLLLFPSLLIFPMGSRENIINGNNLYKEGNFEDAVLEYTEGLTKKSDYNLYYNRGVSNYKLGQFDKSFSDFEDAATYANTNKDQIKAVYNAGNSNFMMAETVKTENPGQALDYYTKSVSQFERVLELEPNNADASYNLELSRLRLDEIKQQENEEQQEGDQQSDNESEDGQQDGEKQKSQDGSQQEDQQQQDQQQQQQDQQQQQQDQQQNQEAAENSESSYLSKDISPEDILNEEARREEAVQLIISSGSGETVDKDW